jgi:hypothetical protein
VYFEFVHCQVILTEKGALERGANRRLAMELDRVLLRREYIMVSKRSLKKKEERLDIGLATWGQLLCAASNK